SMWGLSATTAALMRALCIVMGAEPVIDGLDFVHGGGLLRAQALCFVRAMKALDEGILLRLPGRTDDGFDAKTEQKAHKGGGKIPPASTAHEARVAVAAQTLGQAIGLKDGQHRGNDRGRSEVTPDGIGHEDRGAGLTAIKR